MLSHSCLLRLYPWWSAALSESKCLLTQSGSPTLQVAKIDVVLYCTISRCDDIGQ